MDRREAMTLSGSASYFMQRGLPGSANVLQGSQGIHPISDHTLPYQSNVGGSSIGSTLPVEPSSAILPPHGVNMGAPSQGERVRKKRGRPRKYGPQGAMSLTLSPSSSTTPAKLTPIQKRGRGRPPGSGQKQQLASFGQGLSGTARMGFTPHIITIAVGEDITTKIMSFSQQGSKAMCILSASGAISTATLRQPSTSGGTVKYEGHFEILCLSGSYLSTDNGGPSGRTGGLSVSLASPDGRVVGGGVGGVLIAANPVQVIIGSFLCGSSKTKNKTGESLESAEDSDHQTVDNPVSPSSTQPSQNLTPTTSMGVWSGSQNAHGGIDLMRG